MRNFNIRAACGTFHGLGQTGFTLPFSSSRSLLTSPLASFLLKEGLSFGF